MGPKGLIYRRVSSSLIWAWTWILSVSVELKIREYRSGFSFMAVEPQAFVREREIAIRVVRSCFIVLGFATEPTKQQIKCYRYTNLQDYSI
jgi:hypothetical protein